MADYDKNAREQAKFTPLIPGKVYVIATKHATLYLKKVTENDPFESTFNPRAWSPNDKYIKIGHMQPILLVSFAKKQYEYVGYPEKYKKTYHVYHFLWDNQLYDCAVEPWSDTLSQWMLPVENFYRFTGKRKKQKKIGTKYAEILAQRLEESASNPDNPNMPK